jgi:hypothetical protein
LSINIKSFNFKLVCGKVDIKLEVGIQATEINSDFGRQGMREKENLGLLRMRQNIDL